MEKKFLKRRNPHLIYKDHSNSTKDALMKRKAKKDERANQISNFTKEISKETSVCFQDLII